LSNFYYELFFLQSIDIEINFYASSLNFDLKNIFYYKKTIYFQKKGSNRSLKLLVENKLFVSEFLTITVVVAF